MKRFLLIFVPISASVVVASQQIALPPADLTVTGFYASETGERVEVVGVCHVTEASVACWDRNGINSPVLKTRVEENLERTRGQPEGLRFRFKAKNRLIVVGTATKSGSLQVNTHRNNQNAQSSLNLSSPISDSPAEFPISYTVLNLSFEQDATTTFVDVTEPMELPSPEPFPFKKGGKVEFEGNTYVMDSTPRGEVQDNGYRTTKYWIATMSSDMSAKSSFQLNCNVIGTDGTAISAIDANGKPFNQIELATQRAKAAIGSGSYFAPNNAYVSFRLDRGSRVASLSSSVDPKYIREVRLSITKMRRIRIEGIPLDPKRN